MSREDKNRLVPRLRFPEFKGEWSENCILKIATMKARIGWQNLRQDEHLDQGEYYLLTGTDFQFDKIDWLHAKFVSYDRYIQDQNIILEEGDILITKDGSIGKVAYVENLQNKKATLNNGIFRIRVNGECPKFIYYTFLSSRFVIFLQKLSGGSSIVHLYQKDFEKYQIAYPNYKEQQKIASCLSSLDDLITAHSQKLEALKAHKKGLMQQLFPAEGEAVPKLRFEEFREIGEWGKMVLGDMVNKVGSGVTPLGGESNYKKIGRPFVRSQNVGWGMFLLDDIVFIDELTHKDSINTEINLEDVLLNITGASIGRSAVADNRISGGNVNQHVCIIRTNKNILNPFFLNQFLISTYGQKQIDSFQAGGNRQGLNFAQIRSFCIPVPHIEEQQKIATCLSFLDELISAQGQKIEALKAHKKGLMQGLFPNPYS